MNVTSLTGNGLKDWLIQRVTAVYLMAYIFCAGGCFFLHAPMTYTTWAAWCHSPWIAVSTVLALFSLTLHAWIGLWTVTTDYMKCTVIRLSVQMIIAVILLSQFIWGCIIVWGA